MKKLFLAVLSLLLFACPSDDSPAPLPQGIEGTWLLTRLLVDIPVDFNMDGMVSTDLVSEIGCFDQTFTFNVDNTGSVNITQSADFELVLVAGTSNMYEYEIDCIQENFSESLTWTLNGNDISIDIDGDNLDGTFSGDLITLVLEDGGDFETNQDGAVVEIVSDLTFVLTKQ